MNKVTKKLLLMVFAFVVVLSGLLMLPFMKVNADTVSNASDLQLAVENNEVESIVLNADIDYSDELSIIINGANKVLDLNGHTLNITTDDDIVVRYYSNNSLTIKDSSLLKTGTINATAANSTRLFFPVVYFGSDEADLIVNSGNIVTNRTNIFADTNNFTLTINGGVFTTGASLLNFSGMYNSNVVLKSLTLKGYTNSNDHTMTLGGGKFFDDVVSTKINGDAKLYYIDNLKQFTDSSSNIMGYNYPADGTLSLSTEEPPKYYVITFNSNGGTPVASQAVLAGEKAVEPDKPTRDVGQVMTGWHEVADFSGGSFSFYETINKNYTLYARWAYEPNFVTYDKTTKHGNTGGLIDYGSGTGTNWGGYIYEGESRTITAVPNSGYKFIGWATYDEEKTILSTNPSIQITYGYEGARSRYAVFEQSHKITYNTNGGSYITPSLVGLTEVTVKPEDPTKKGCNFITWYTDPELTEPFAWGNLLDEDITLYADWEVVTTYIESFNITGIEELYGGNVPSVANISINHDGVSIREINWYEDEPTWMEDGPAQTFVTGKKYILIIDLQLADGYEFDELFNEDYAYTNLPYLKSEFVRERPDLRIYYEAKAKPAITAAINVNVVNANENSVIVSWNDVDFVEKFDVYRSTSKTSGFKKIATVTENSYTDEGLTYGTTYYYKVVAINNTNSKTSSVGSGKAIPNKVSNLRIDGVGSTNVKVAYDKVNVTGYEIHYGTSASKMSLGGTVTSSNTLTYNKTGLKANTTYYFKVRAYKTVGKTKVYGTFSDIVSVKTGPSAPSVTVSNKDYKSLSIKINSVTGGVNYKLEVSTDKTNYSLVEELPVAGVYVHSDLTPGMTYYYRAKACNSEGSCGSYSSVVSKKVIPNAPVLTVNKNTENKLMIKVNEQEGVTGYHIYRSTSKTKNFKKVGSTETTEYLDTNLTYGTTYYYKVVAYNENSESAYSNVASGKTVPETVENLKVDSVTSTSIKVSYDKVNVTGYEVYYGTSTKNMKKATTISNSNTLSYNKTSLKANTTYYFKVRAYKKIGSKKVYGSYSSILTVKTAPAVPKVTLSLKNYDTLSLKINASSGATKYMVTYSYNNDFSEPVNLLFEDANTYTLDGLDFGKTVYLKARACNASDGCSSWVTLNKKVTTLVPAFTLKTSSKAVTVTLTSVDGASGYEIYRSNYSNKKFSLVKTFTTEDELLEFVNSTSKGKKYYYKVRSYKVVDDVTIYSDYSSVKNIKSK